jgi:hypothetical protein
MAELFAESVIIFGEVSNLSTTSFMDNYRRNTLIDNLDKLKNILEMDCSSISEIWSDAIKYDLDISLAIDIIKTEFRRMAVNDAIENAMALVRTDIRKLDRAAYQSTLNLYAILSELQNHVKDPSGSYLSFNQTVRSSLNEFARTLSLAKLE